MISPTLTWPKQPLLPPTEPSHSAPSPVSLPPRRRAALQPNPCASYPRGRSTQLYDIGKYLEAALSESDGETELGERFGEGRKEDCAERVARGESKRGDGGWWSSTMVCGGLRKEVRGGRRPRPRIRRLNFGIELLGIALLVDLTFCSRPPPPILIPRPQGLLAHVQQLSRCSSCTSTVLISSPPSSASRERRLTVLLLLTLAAQYVK